MQAMDESMWEFISLHLRDPLGRINRPGSLIRIGAICIAFYRLMLQAGLPSEAALAEIAQACETFEGPLEPPFSPEGCSLAEYFRAKAKWTLCEASFCNRCVRKDTGCRSLDRMRAEHALEPVEA